MHLDIGRPAPDPASASARAADRGRLLAGFGLVTFLAAIHAAHAVSHRYPVAAAAFSGAMIVAQCAALTAGRALAVRRGAARWARWAGLAAVSAVFGALAVLPLSSSWHFAGASLAEASAVVGAAVSGAWLLLFVLPAAVERVRLRARELEALRREAELARLRVHLHPHFLLNTLNAIAGLVTEDPAEARRLIAALGDLVRDAVEGGDELQPFRVEAAWLRRYAELLEARHRGVLAFRWELAEETLAVRTPRLLLQPLVENAVKHGALRRPEGGSVVVRSEVLDGGAVRFTVEDDGPGPGPARRDGLGIDLVRRRLALLCPGATLRHEPRPTGGTRAVVVLPAAEGGA